MNDDPAHTQPASVERSTRNDVPSGASGSRASAANASGTRPAGVRADGVMTNSGPTEVTPPFGAFCLSSLREAVRGIGDHAPDGKPGRWLVSGVRRLAIKGVREPIDVATRDGLKLRLHPSTNRCEKRAVSGIHLWDTVERAAIRSALDQAQTSPEQPFVMLDVGANVGLYSLDVGAHARRTGKTVRLIAVEPDVENGRRLKTNAALSDIKVELQAVAIGEFQATGHMTGGSQNRGEVHFAAINGDASDETGDAGSDGIEMIPLYALCDRLGVTRVDVLKLDVEGHDLSALRGFFETAPEALYPSLIIVETGHLENDAGRSEIAALCERHGYRLRQQVGINAILQHGT